MDVNITFYSFFVIKYGRSVKGNKSDLREMTEYRSVFLEQDVSREEREKRRVMIQERKAEWELRGKMDQRRKN